MRGYYESYCVARAKHENTSFVFDLNGMKFKAWIPEDLVLESNARVTYKVELY